VVDDRDQHSVAAADRFLARSIGNHPADNTGGKVNNVTEKPQYTVSRCTKNDKPYGPIHGARDIYVTLCGLDVDEWWCIVDNNQDGTITCPKCLKVMQGTSDE